MIMSTSTPAPEHSPITSKSTSVTLQVSRSYRMLCIPQSPTYTYPYIPKPLHRVLALSLDVVHLSKMEPGYGLWQFFTFFIRNENGITGWPNRRAADITICNQGRDEWEPLWFLVCHPVINIRSRLNKFLSRGTLDLT